MIKSLRLFPVIALTGPTGVGKTAVSLRLCQELDGEVVNYDSVQVYKGMDIGSAKPTPEEQSVCKHHLLDILEPDEPHDAAGFVRRARHCIQTIRKKGKVPILAGGTNLYLKLLIDGFGHDEAGQDPALRQSLQLMAEQFGVEALHNLLADIDPVSADKINPNDAFRIIRSLEIYAVTGMPASTWRSDCSDRDASFPVLKVGLTLERNKLYERINRRVEKMFDAGLVDEVKGLLDSGFSQRLKPMQSLGYRHVVQFLAGEFGFEELARQVKRDHRRYARKQLIWLRKDPLIRWFDAEKLLREKNIWHRITFFNC